MGEPTTGPASCAYKHSAREEASGRFGDAMCKDVVSEPCQRNPRWSAPEPRKLRGGRPAQNHRSAAVVRPEVAYHGRKKRKKTRRSGAPRTVGN